MPNGFIVASNLPGAVAAFAFVAIVLPLIPTEDVAARRSVTLVLAGGMAALTPTLTLSLCLCLCLSLSPSLSLFLSLTPVLALALALTLTLTLTLGAAGLLTLWTYLVFAQVARARLVFP